jgi:hypothetical protein
MSTINISVYLTDSEMGFYLKHKDSINSECKALVKSKMPKKVE